MKNITVRRFRKSKRKCYLCGRPLRTEMVKTIDHFVPTSRGGSNRKENLRVSCSDCNTLKGDLLLNEFWKWIETATSEKAKRFWMRYCKYKPAAARSMNRTEVSVSEFSGADESGKRISG